MINTKGLEKAKVLKALYDRAKPQRLGLLSYNPAPMSLDEAKRILVGDDKYFDYLHGRVMKVDLQNDDEFDERLYDRDNGFGAAQKAIDALRAES